MPARYRDHPFLRARSGHGRGGRRMALKCAPAQACPLIMASAVDLPPKGCGPGPPGQRGAPHWTTDLDPRGLVCSARPGRWRAGRSGPTPVTYDISPRSIHDHPGAGVPAGGKTSSLGYEPYDERLRRLGQSLADAVTSAARQITVRLVGSVSPVSLHFTASG
jgi:hypothetical protein